MKQRPIQNRLSPHALVVAVAVVAVTGMTNHLRADPDKQANKNADQNAAKQIAGTYVGDGVTITIEWKDSRPSGVIVRNEKTFPFIGQTDGKGIKGTFQNGGISIEFSATLKSDELTFVSGASTYKLKKQVSAQSIAGTYQQGENSISIAEANGKFTGFFVLKGKRSAVAATKQGQRVVGHYTQDGKKYPFSATLNGDVLTVALGIEQIKLKRVSNTGGIVQINRKISATVLAKSTEAIDSTILVNENNTKVAYATRHPDRFAFQMWINDKALQTDGEPQGMRFSANGRRFAHMLKKGDEHYVVIDDKRSDPYSEVIVRVDVFSKDGKRSIFAGRSGTPWRIVVDGKPGPPFDKLNIHYGFSANGQRYAYLGERNGKWHVVVDGELSPPYEAVQLSFPTFSEDSQHVHYSIVRDKKQVPIVDGREIGEHDAITDMRFSPTGDRHAYIALDDGFSRVIVDGVATRQYERIGRLKFSPDGKSLAFPVRIDGKSAMIVNGKRIGEMYDRLSAPKFSPDGKKFLFLAQQKDKQFLVMNGKPSSDYDVMPFAKFSPNSQRVGFVAKKNDRWFVVVDGKASKPYFNRPEHFNFSPDSKHFIYVAKRDGSTYLVIDGTEGKPIWPMLPSSRIVFDEANRLHTVVRRADEFIRLDVEITK